MKRLGITLIGITVFCGLLVYGFSTQSPKADQITSSPMTGRYVLVLNPEYRADHFLLDTQTGRVWQRVQFKDLKGEPVVYQYVDRLDSAEETLEWMKNNPKKSLLDQIEDMQKKQPKP